MLYFVLASYLLLLCQNDSTQTKCVYRHAMTILPKPLVENKMVIMYDEQNNDALDLVSRLKELESKLMIDQQILAFAEMTEPEFAIQFANRFGPENIVDENRFKTLFDNVIIN